MSKYVYGIDLGTTYSCIAYQDEDGRPTVIKNIDTNSTTTPSVVQWDEEGNVVVGQQAKESATLYPDRTVSFVKQLIGKSQVAAEVDGNMISPIEASSHILRELAKFAGEQLDDEVQDVIITCPAYFGESERTATKQAGEIAGLNVLAIIEEPTAAAICYGITRSDEDKNVLIFDLGGGTFDITVMSITQGEIRVITTEGDHQLGGKFWDEKLGLLIVEKFRSASGYPTDPYEDEDNEEFLQDIAMKAEKAKQALTNKTSTKQAINYNGYKAMVEITREEFETATAELAQSALDLTDKAIQTVKDQGLHIDEVLLVGGSTKMPHIQEGVKAHLGLEPKIFEPDEAVAKGAAIYAMLQADEQSKLSENEEKTTNEQGQEVAVNKETGASRVLPSLGPGGSTMPLRLGGSLRIVSVSTKSFGVKAISVDTGEELIFNLIQKDDEIPASTKQTFGTLEDNQASVEIRIYQTPDKVEQYPVDEDRFLGTADLTLNPNTPAGSEIEITLSLSSDGMVRMEAKDLTSGRNIEAHWQAENVLSEQEIAEAKARVASTALTI